MKNKEKPGTVAVCISSHPKTFAMLRMAKRRAEQLGTDWEALYIITPDTVQEQAAITSDHPDFLQSDDMQMLQSLTLAEQMGANVRHIDAPSVAKGIIRYLKLCINSEQKLHTLILGEEENKWLFRWLKLPLSMRLKRHIPDDIVLEVIPLDGALSRRLRWYERLRIREVRIRELLYALLAVATASAVAEGMQSYMPQALFRVNEQNIALIYMTACAFAAGRFGLVPGLVAAVVSFLSMNFFFMAPYHRLSVDNITLALNMGLFLTAAILIAVFVSHARASAEEVMRQERRTQALFRLHRVTLQANSRRQVLEMLYAELRNLLEAKVSFFMPNPDNMDELIDAFPGNSHLNASDIRARDVAWEEGKTTGFGSPYDPGCEWRFEPLFTVDNDYGVLGMHLEQGMEINLSITRLLSALSVQVALILERVNLTRMMEATRLSEEREKLRSMLLSSVSHDLKTPLASIIGSLSVFRSMGPALSEEQRVTLIDTAQEEAQRLDSFITNILDMTRIESGDIDFKVEWGRPLEIIQRVKKTLRDRLQHHVLEINCDAEDTEVYMDVMLMEQVLQNILDNACKYTSPGTRIELNCSPEGERFVFIIRDHGKGLPEERIHTVFDKYARLHKEDSQIAGTGLGLAICKSVMHAQNGDVIADNHPDGGARFTITLPEWRKVTDKTEVA